MSGSGQVSADARLARSLQQQEYAQARHRQRQMQQQQQQHRHVDPRQPPPPPPPPAPRVTTRPQHSTPQQSGAARGERPRRQGSPTVQVVRTRHHHHQHHPRAASEPRTDAVRTSQGGPQVFMVRSGTRDPLQLLQALMRAGMQGGGGGGVPPQIRVLMHQRAPRQQGVNRDTIEGNSGKFTLGEVSALPEESRSCAVCQMEFERGEEVRALPCLHLFHPECVDRWLTTKRECPTCRADITDMERQAGALLSDGR